MDVSRYAARSAATALSTVAVGEPCSPGALVESSERRGTSTDRRCKLGAVATAYLLLNRELPCKGVASDELPLAVLVF